MPADKINKNKKSIGADFCIIIKRDFTSQDTPFSYLHHLSRMAELKVERALIDADLLVDISLFVFFDPRLEPDPVAFFENAQLLKPLSEIEPKMIGDKRALPVPDLN